MDVLNVETMCLTRLCGEICYRMSELAGMSTGPRYLGARRIQSRPQVYRADAGKTVVISSAPKTSVRVRPADARMYLDLLRKGFASTLNHWQQVVYEISKESPKLVIELFFMQRDGLCKLVVFAGDQDYDDLVAEHMSDGETIGWYMEYSYIE